MTDTLIVIPVRGNSAGLPRKAFRQLGGKSPLLRTIETAKQLDADVVVTTDDHEALVVAHGADVATVLQPPALCQPDIPLDAPVYHAVQSVASREHDYAIVVTMQCTSPFTTPETVHRCIALAREFESCVTVRDDRGLRWHAEPGVHLAGRAPYRIVRQQMPPEFRETGAVLATQRPYVTPTYRFGHTVYLLEVSGKEAVDLDTPEDWAVAEMYAGATEREMFLARVLTDTVHRGEGAILSAWDEGADEQQLRSQFGFATCADVIVLVGQNTHDEAQLAIAKRRANDLTIVTSAYHMPRAFLTFLQVLKDQQLEQTVRLWCAPAASGMAKLSEEWQKITAYQAKGHVARVDEGLAYLQWRDGLQWGQAHVCVA